MRFYILIVLASITSEIALGASVDKINIKKKIVLINEGTATGYLKKKKVCFLDENEARVACGVIRSTKTNAAAVYVKSDANLAKIKLGMKAILDVKNKDPQITLAPEEKKPADDGYKAPHYVGFFGAFPVVDTVSYQNIIYETPLGQATSSMWTADSAVQSASFGAELGFGISSFTLALGGRSRTFAPKRVASDYEDKDGDTYFEDYAESIGKGSSLGFWLDFYWLRWDWGVASLNLGTGVDYDSSTVNFTMEKKSEDNDNTFTLYDVKSALKVTSLRNNLLLDFKFGSVGFKMGLLLFVPLSQTPSLSVTQSDPFTTASLQGTTPEEDVKSALGHKAKFGAELMIMGYLAY